ncbi:MULTISPECIES: sigma-70 family RNA polymerase sigma factor [unclassified Paenibacillus]|uniref:RNA polymerase sigma factor n=1 Tax=unclassified Paenibacillus TaxID=185978 RepID=UPI0024056858|nr:MULTISPECIES: sigma-70 family RNA polymerase sigma factor [unclassified Paenibacillus]MDF9839852.1 RNA polymerase sigma factor (sigma-70 family) [Paenibacillus sp. PastF-2]MDF9846433.1 RNA polymerase sigma factor (sigma-70 family) [Paenibacillus sp. PastM-2]MDF9853218.1 RNA polymerase sigma factor (sigma-70 family) [Paenibacillus sp. PastF-1]MDH6478278.1 RNA polymerase sigma factor (sigma-70 family) [Paenibacillus sp. PastH-2]MDH6506223.1 RNA polymerase sigma factor (sigma-70 family) [Paeni
MNEVADDVQLMQQIRQKDPDALEKLYDRYEQMVYSFAYRIVKDSMAAEEVMQELFMRIWKNPEQYDSAKGKLSTWMFTVTRNIAIDQLRKINTRPPQQSADAEELQQLRDTGAMTEDMVEMLLAGEQIREALQELSRDQQQVMDLIYYQGLTQQEVAYHVAVPLGTVKSRVRLAMKQLQKRLIHWGRRDQAHD